MLILRNNFIIPHSYLNIKKVTQNGVFTKSCDTYPAIPKEKVATYGLVATLASKPRGACGVAWLRFMHLK